VVLSLSPTQNHLLPQQIAKKEITRVNYTAFHETYLEGFETECSSEVSVGIFRVALDYDREVFDSRLVVLDHLIGFGSLVDVPDV
jgi:hypothetical protein